MKQSFILLTILMLAFQANTTRIQKRSADNQHKIGGAKNWGYRNEDKSILPPNWHETHPKCYGNQQSPINIESHETIYDKNLTQLVISSIFKDSKQPKESWSIKNNGHSGNDISRDIIIILTIFQYKVPRVHVL